MSVYFPDIKSLKPEVRSGHICFEFRGNIFIWGGYNVSDLYNSNKYKHFRVDTFVYEYGS
jgi:hypothetical protein